MHSNEAKTNMAMTNYKRMFPIFQEPGLVYLDSAATTHKPSVVIDRISRFYASENAPVHRGIYALAEHATVCYESVREKTAAFLNAHNTAEIIFTRGTTEGVNAVVAAWGEHAIGEGDEIVLSTLEHHAMLVPWQQLAKRKGAVLTFMPITPTGELDYEAALACITSKTKFVGISAGSNVVGIALNLAPIIERAHAVGARVLVDAAQIAPRIRIDVQKLACDFLVFSGHKMAGPTGVGVLYIKQDLHSSLHPFLYGGSMISSVSLAESTWKKMPELLEAGTPPIAQVIGLGAALDFLTCEVDFNWLAQHEAALCAHFLNGIADTPTIVPIGPINRLKQEGHLVSFFAKGMHAYDVATYLDSCGIAVRAGHHCAQPLHTALGIPSTVRASFYLYNTLDDVDQLVSALKNMLPLCTPTGTTPGNSSDTKTPNSTGNAAGGATT